jgi:hypothetical protein
MTPCAKEWRCSSRDRELLVCASGAVKSQPRKKTEQNTRLEYSSPGPSSVTAGGSRLYVSWNHRMSCSRAAARSMPVFWNRRSADRKRYMP